VESLGPINCSPVSFLSGIGRRIAEVSGEMRESRSIVMSVSVRLSLCLSASISPKLYVRS